jgi:hypothetical protein
LRDWPRTVGSIKDVNVSANEWVSAFARELGLDEPSDEETTSILALAGIAAHSSDRTAAPVACWLAAKAGLSASGAVDTAQKLVVPDHDDQ